MPLSWEELLADLDEHIAAARRHLQQLESARAALVGIEFVLAEHKTQSGMSNLGIEIVVTNNSLQKAKREGNKSLTKELEQRLVEMREQLKQQNAEQRQARRQQRR